MSQLTYLNRREYRTLRAINEVLYPPGGTIPQGANDIGVCEYVDDYVYNHKPKHRRMMRLLFWFLEFAPLVMSGAHKRLSELNVEQRQAFLEGLEQSRLYAFRMLLISIRTIVGMAFMADEGVLRAMGYFKDCPYPGDKRTLPTSDEIEGAKDILPKEVRHAG